MSRGDHIWVRRGCYTHHGIDAGDGTVIHFAGKPGRGMRDATVARSTIGEFVDGGRLRTRRHLGADDVETVMGRAESRLGTGGYRLLRNNCEHFATWCQTGRARSGQVRDDALSVSALALAGALLTARLLHPSGRTSAQRA